MAGGRPAGVQESPRREEAKQLLAHYFRAAGVSWNGEVLAEIGTIVDLIVDAADQECAQIVQEAVARALEAKGSREVKST